MRVRWCVTAPSAHPSAEPVEDSSYGAGNPRLAHRSIAAGQKDLLQTLAVIGREFAFGLLKSVVSRSEDELNRMLSELQLAEFIYEQPAAGDLEYTFKHALTQEVAYNSVLVERRKLLHGRIGVRD